MTLEIGTHAPPFTLRRQAGEKISLDDLAGAKSMIVFVPFPFTRTCTAELCQLRDSLDVLNRSETRVVVITTHATSTNAEWARQEGFEFDILADYWPHGEVSRMYDAFDDTFGYSKRVTYFLDDAGLIRDVVASEAFGKARDYDSYEAILASY
jgi:mycoredoxin-dependent peroxiredoxin